ncbi:MAG: M16 family metallopeptidase [Planctomycetota bacterium]|jgi:predicted Zn-dependent peptidase
MKFKKKILSNGLTIIGEINKSAKSVAVGFFVKTGARDETEEINGVSHFLEHMLFKGTEKMTAIEVNEAFDRTGAQFNAGTSWENTIFYSAVLPEYLAEVTELWIELMRPRLREDDFNIEKNVIKEEIAMYQDMPSFDVIDRCHKLYFDKHPCGNSILGTTGSIDGLTAEKMRNYFDSRYVPNNMILAVAGNFDWERIGSITEEKCSSWEKITAERKLQDCKGNNYKERIDKKSLTREHICLMSPAVSAQDSSRFAASLLATIVGSTTGSRFFWELVDKAIAETAVMQFGPMDGTGVFYSCFQCSDSNAEKVIGIVENIFSNLSRDGISKDELEKAKNKTLSALVLKNELPMGRLSDLGSNWLYLREYRTVEQDVRAIKEVSVDDINCLIKQCNLNSFTQFSIGPTKT